MTDEQNQVIGDILDDMANHVALRHLDRRDKYVSAIQTLRDENERLKEEVEEMRRIFAGLAKAYKWKEQLFSERARGTPDKNEEEKANQEFDDTLDTAVKFANPAWTETYMQRVQSGNIERARLRKRLATAVFEFDERSYSELEQLRDQGHELLEIVLVNPEDGETRAVVIPKNDT